MVYLPRTAKTYLEALDSFQVETNKKYLPEDLDADGKKETKCNWFVEDACELLGVHIPKGLLARLQLLWLGGPDGRNAQWFECAEADAGMHVQLGHPCIVGWINPDPKRSSHVAMLRTPGRICQAGAKNYNDVPVAFGFGHRQVSYFAHL